jgi:hypothetical protein
MVAGSTKPIFTGVDVHKASTWLMRVLQVRLKMTNAKVLIGHQHVNRRVPGRYLVGTSILIIFSTILP